MPVQTKPIEAGDYIVYKQPIDSADLSKGWKWRLEDIKKNVTEHAGSPGPGSPNQIYYNTDDGKSYIWNGTTWIDLTQLYIVDIDASVDSDGDHNYKNDADTYNHALVEEDNALGKELAVKTIFRRQIKIKYLNDNGNETTDTGANRMIIQSKVTWREGKNEFNTNLETHLADYMDRESLSN